MSETKWTDERIIAEAESVVADYQTDHRMRQHIIATMMQVRNDTQAEIDELRQQLAAQWQPVSDGNVIFHQDDRFVKIVIENGNLVATRTLHDLVVTVALPDNIRLCRRAEEE